MLIIFAILLLLTVPLLMLLFHLTRWKYASNWLVAVIGMLMVWPMVLLTHQYLPQSFSYLSWEPKYLFPVSPTLLVDEVSWTFSLVLVTLGLTLVLTAVARTEQTEPINEQPSLASLGVTSARITNLNWPTWAGGFLIIGLGLVAVQSGNLLTTLLAWAALDIIELITLLAHVIDSKGRQQAIITFSIRAISIGMLILTEIQIWRTDGIISLSSISPRTSIYLLIAAGLRLGVLPLHLPFKQELSLRRGLGTILRLVSAAASMSLLVRAATVGLGNPVATYLLLLSVFTAILGAGIWAMAPDELHGRSYWILGTASMATASAISGSPAACLAWSCVSLLVGGLLFFTSLRRPWLRVLMVAGFLGLSGLPFTPNWIGVRFYTSIQDMSDWVSIALIIGFVAAHALLVVGYLRHSMRSTLINGDNPRDPQVERWIWLIYPVGLTMLPLTHILIGYWTLPDYRSFPIAANLSGLASTTLGFGGWYLYHHTRSIHKLKSTTLSFNIPSKLLSLPSLYQPIWYLFRQLQRISTLVHAFLEGDGGILWAIVLFFFILIFIQR